MNNYGLLAIYECRQLLMYYHVSPYDRDIILLIQKCTLKKQYQRKQYLPLFKH